ncbi:uncharacterized protein LOC130702917 [Daphnia carinata]|uniref:uncharacterized protein LOC130702917 n=1 Tax=Daphnia carinata TaxID=120202 RepID=UPI0025807BFF|nr:uncharacterized protein LOC130702917 [Daphnia carinata]
MQSCISSANMRANSGPILLEQDCNGDNGAVLKQLLLTGKGDVRIDYSKRKGFYPISLANKPSSSIQSSANQLCIPLMKSKQSREFSLQRESGVHAAHPSHHIWMREAERWSPPVLTAPLDGSAYSPPSTPVAHIEPYVEPQVMYNPYFLWQLYSYKQSCNNNYYSLSQYQQIC